MANQEKSNGSKTANLDSLAHLTIVNHAQVSIAQETAFIGRARELAAIEQHFQNPGCHLLSLIGLGGVGKTRIAWESGARLAGDFAHGVYFIPFAAIDSTNLIVPAICAAVGYRAHGPETPQAQLFNFLRSRETLLILDNFEHLIDGGTDLLAEMLQAAPDVRLLITSRERLNLREEWVIDIHGLDYPADETDAENFSAVQLFIQNARRVKDDFQLTAANRADVIRVCRLVEGMPLGIELAAAWTRALSCRAIGDEIAHNLDFLTTNLRNVPEKHRSMRAVFARSYHLLPADQQQVFAKLSVFRGGFQREAAESIAGASLMTLADFADKSLLRISADGRYDMHELLRQFGYEQLQAMAVSERVRDAHSAYYADFLHQRVEDLKGRRQLEALREINTDFENIQTAWEWAAIHKRDDLINRMIEGLWLYGELRGRSQRRQVLFRSAEQHFAPPHGEAAHRVWGRLLARVTDEMAGASQEQLETALQIAMLHDDLPEITHCLNRLGIAASACRDFTRATQLLEQSVNLCRQVGDRYYLARALWYLSFSDYELQWEKAKAVCDESLRLSSEIGDKIGRALSLWMKGLDEARVGSYIEAERSWHERIALGRETGNLELTALSYAHLGYQVYLTQGKFSEARAAAEEALRIANAMGYSDPAGWALVTLGVLASMDEQYLEAKALCQQGAAAGVLAHIADFAAWGSALAACGLGDVNMARECFPAAWSYGMKLFGRVGVCLCLPISAWLLAHQGSTARAVEQLALAFTFPINAYGWMEKWPLLARLRADLEKTLGSEAYTAAWERGKLLDTDDVAAQFTTGSAIEKGNQPLIEPLTERELEIIRLITDGLSNQEIADRLILSLGTIKWYTTQIYSKLNVQNRTQAVRRAQELNLLS